jgi:hypothetical protein
MFPAWCEMTPYGVNCIPWWLLPDVHGGQVRGDEGGGGGGVHGQARAVQTQEVRHLRK